MGVIQGFSVNRFSRVFRVGRFVGLAFLAAWSAGCSTPHAASSQRLLERQWQLDFSGLKATQANETLRITSAPPQNWRPLPLQKTSLYTHQQWKSPTTYTGAGVVFIHLPIPMNAKMLIWLAKLEYSKTSKDGKLLNEWTDDVGRPWFEGVNVKYHVRGYAVVDGFNAWIVYFGYKANRPINAPELGLAARYVQTVVPLTGNSQSAKLNVADAGAAAALK